MRYDLKYPLRFLGIVAGVILVIYACMAIRGPGYVGSAKQFREFVRSEPQIRDLKNWLMIYQGSGKDVERFKSVGREDWPAGLNDLRYKNHNPAYLNVREQPKAAMLEYGGGFGHWGVIVVADSKDLTPITSAFQKDYLLPVDPWMTVWYELN